MSHGARWRTGAGRAENGRGNGKRKILSIGGLEL